jgi:hypothetical protein
MRCNFQHPPGAEARSFIASEAVSGEVRERLLASPGAGDYPPDFLAHEIGLSEPYVIDGSPRARPDWLKEMDEHMAARMTRRRPDGRYQVKVTTVRWRQRRQPVLVRRWKLRPVLVRSWKLRP